MVTTYLVIYYGENFVKPHKWQWFFSINLLAFYHEARGVCELRGFDKVLNG